MISDSKLVAPSKINAHHLIIFLDATTCICVVTYLEKNHGNVSWLNIQEIENSFRYT